MALFKRGKRFNRGLHRRIDKLARDVYDLTGQAFQSIRALADAIDCLDGIDDIRGESLKELDKRIARLETHLGIAPSTPIHTGQLHLLDLDNKGA